MIDFERPLPESPPNLPGPRPAPKPFDLEAAKTYFAGYKLQIADLRKKVIAFEVTTDDTATELTKMATQAATLAKTLDAKRKELIKKPDHFVRSLNAFVKTYRDILSLPGGSGIVELSKKKIGQFQFQKELDRRKKEKAAQDAQDALQAKMDAEAAAVGVVAPQMPAQVIPEKTAPIRTSSGSANFGTAWDYEVDDISKVPVVYIHINHQAVMAGIKAGIREIPGLIIKEVPKIQIRTVG